MKKYKQLGKLLLVATSVFALTLTAGCGSAKKSDSTASSTTDSAVKSSSDSSSLDSGSLDKKSSDTADSHDSLDSLDSSSSSQTHLSYSSESTPGDVISFQDMTGASIVTNSVPKKVVVLSAADCEILYAIGAGNLVVGRGEYCDYPEEVKSVKEVASGANTNIEQIIALKPDMLFTDIMAQDPKQLDAISENENGTIVVKSNADNIDGVYKCIEIIGKATRKDDKAKELVTQMKDEFKKIQDAAASDKNSFNGKSVYFEVSPLDQGLWTAGKGTFMDEIATMLGLKNIFSDVDGWAEVSEEQVIERNPDYIVTVAMSDSTGKSPTDEIAARKGWDVITAVKDSHIYQADNNEITRPGPRLTKAASDFFDYLQKN